MGSEVWVEVTAKSESSGAQPSEGLAVKVTSAGAGIAILEVKLLVHPSAVVTVSFTGFVPLLKV